MSNYSSLNMKGTVNITATDVNSGAVVQSQTVTNTIVRNGRVALSKLITGEAATDKSYLILDATGGSGLSLNGFPRTYVVPSSPTVHDSWMGITNSGIPCMYYLGPKYTHDPAVNANLAPVTYDIYGFVTYLNGLFNTYTSGEQTEREVPIYQYDGTKAAYIPRTIPSLKASVVNISGVDRVKIEAVQGGTGSILPYSTTIETESGCLDVSGTYDPYGIKVIPQVRFQTDDCLFGVDTIAYTAQGIPTAESDYVVNGVQLGVSNGTTNITDSEFVSGTYVSPRYTPSVAYGQADAEGLYDTQVIFTAVIPASEGNGESGLGVTYTEAALLCRNEQWFAHTHFGQFYKSNQIQLTITWTVDFMP